MKDTCLCREFDMIACFANMNDFFGGKDEHVDNKAWYADSC